MEEKWIWLPDFASDMGIWEDDLAVISPEADHLFVPYEKMVSFLDRPYDESNMVSATTAVGWGLGAFVLLKNAAKRPRGQRLILLSPFADYCSEYSEWTVENLSFIAHQTLTASDATVNAFYELLGDEPGEWQEDWLKCARRTKPDALRQGLEYMAKNRIDSSVDVGEGDIRVLYGRMDRAIPPSMTTALADFMPGVEFRERPKAGHWPPMLLF